MIGIDSDPASGNGTDVAIDSVTIDVPSFDRWMYINSGSTGDRGTASTFSALPVSTEDENRLAQFIIGFDTDAGGLPTPDWQTVQITRVSVTATSVAEGSFSYDSTEDPFASYLAAGTAPDTGRPLSIHGTGYRNDYDATTFLENSPHGSTLPYGRNAFAMGFDENGDPMDVSHNVTDGFEAFPWATGTSNLSVGSAVPADTVFDFEIDQALTTNESLTLRSEIAGKPLYKQLFRAAKETKKDLQQGENTISLLPPYPFQ